MTPLIIALVSFATALVAGLLLSKAFFTTRNLKDSVTRKVHYESLGKQRARYRNQLVILHNKAREKISALRKKITAQQREIDVLEASRPNNNSTRAFYDAKYVESLRVEIAVLRENLESRDDRIGVLNLEIRENHVNAQKLLTNLNAWKNRVAPLTRKMHEQRELIDSIQNFQEQEDHSEFDTATHDKDATEFDSQEIEDQEIRTDSQVEIQPDDLKKIRGIGPALERRLNTTGVSRFQQLAELSERELSDLAEKISVSPTVAERDQWVQQARSLQSLGESASLASA